MAITNGQVSVTAGSAALIVPSLVAGGQIMVTNSGSKSCYLGDASVTSSTGVLLVANWAQPIVVGPNEPIYAICAGSDSTTVSYMVTSAKSG